MKTTKQILETESFQCMPDGFDVLINKKWFSEEEIRKAIEELFKYNKEKGTQLAFIGKNALYKKLFGDERAEIFKFLENYTNVEVN